MAQPTEPSSPRRCAIADGFGRRTLVSIWATEVILCGCIRFDPVEEPFIERRQLFGFGKIRIAGEFSDALAVDVAALVVERHCCVEWVCDPRSSKNSAFDRTSQSSQGDSSASGRGRRDSDSIADLERPVRR